MVNYSDKLFFYNFIILNRLIDENQFCNFNNFINNLFYAAKGLRIISKIRTKIAKSSIPRIPTNI